MKKKATLGAQNTDRFANLMAYSVTALLSFIFLLLFSASTSPLFPSYIGDDSAFFCLVGKAMVNGLMPYRDFFDMKGPYLFLIEYLGQLICYGRWGIFILQWINLFIVGVFNIKIFRLLGVKKLSKQLLLLGILALFATVTFHKGNMTEEFSLIPLFASLYFCLKYFILRENGEVFEHNPLYGFFYGVSFGYLALIRITNAALICAIVLSASVCMIGDKKFKNLLINGAAFILGVIVAAAPICFYYYKHGLIEDMIYCVFSFGFTYSSELSIGEHLIDLWTVATWLAVLIMPTVVAFMSHNIGWRLRLLIVAGSIATFVAIASGNAYLHYFTISLPLFIIGAVIVMKNREENRPAERKTTNALRFVLLINSYYFLAAILFVLPHNWQKAEIECSKYEQSVIDMTENIPLEERNSVFSYNVDVEWYYYTDDIFPCNKYCGWQNHYIDLVPEIELELAEMFDNEPPKWLVLPTNSVKEIPNMIDERIDKNYVVEFKNENFTLMRYKHFTVTDVSRP